MRGWVAFVLKIEREVDRMPFTNAQIKELEEKIKLEKLMDRYVIRYLFPVTDYYEYDLTKDEWVKLPANTKFDKNKPYRLQVSVINRAHERWLHEISLRIVNKKPDYLALFRGWDYAEKECVDQVPRVDTVWDELEPHEGRSKNVYLIFKKKTSAAGVEVLAFGRYAVIQARGIRWFKHKLVID
jgi:hypothetical protein